jgi:hypothetical protein
MRYATARYDLPAAGAWHSVNGRHPELAGAELADLRRQYSKHQRQSSAKRNYRRQRSPAEAPPTGAGWCGGRQRHLSAWRHHSRRSTRRPVRDEQLRKTMALDYCSAVICLLRAARTARSGCSAGRRSPARRRTRTTSFRSSPPRAAPIYSPTGRMAARRPDPDVRCRRRRHRGLAGTGWVLRQ